VNAIEVRGLVKEYQKHRGFLEMVRHPFKAPMTRILDGVTIEVPQGQIFGILGANGTGKTTLLKVLATLVRPTEGYARINGWDVVRDEAKARGCVSYAFGEDRSFYWRLTGRQNLEFFATLNDLSGKPARMLIDDLSERFGIVEFLDQPYSYYSSGIKQRFSLARALLSRPRVLLLDEPTRSVDEAHTWELWSLVRERIVSDEGVTVLVVTHRAEEAYEVCNKIAVLKSGRLATQLTPEELRQVADSLRGITLTVEGLQADGLSRLRAVPGVREVNLSQENGHQEIEAWCDDNEVALPGLIAAATAAGATVRAMSHSAPISEVVARLLRDEEDGA
jgi:ABC-2 type transport system ATP-binding protein